MVWGAIASLGASVVGSVISGKSAKKQADAAAEADKAELDFAKEQYQDWLDTYGDLQDNLAEYYNNLTPDTLEVQGLEQFELERERALTNINENLAQRGIATSGLAAAVEIEDQLSSATERARIRAEAPLRSAAERSRFLQIGLGQNPASNLQNVLSDTARDARDRADRSASAAGEAIGGAVSSGLNLLADVLEKKE